MPRIITGSARGIHLFVPKEKTLAQRPTEQRSSLFKNRSSHHRCRSTRSFAGTGQIGLEALSRAQRKLSLLNVIARLLLQFVKTLREHAFQIGLSSFRVTFIASRRV